MKMTNFQLIFTGVFVLLILVGVAVFALFGGIGGKSNIGVVTVWGTVDQTTVDRVLQDLRQTNKELSDVRYVQRTPSTYVADLINAMASGTGPDLFFIGQDEVFLFADKIQVVPYSTLSQSTFINSYIDEGQLFLTEQGALALPLLIDPLVMYWNRDMLASAGVSQPPRYWSDLITLAPKITKLDPSLTIQKSAVALGEWQNISHAKAILTTLFLQAGDPIVARDTSGIQVVVFGTTPQNMPENPAVSALKFYTEFANPSKTTYSWNRSLPKSQDAFTAGDVALYFGMASDYEALKARNPNLRFAVAPLPQIQGNSTTLTFGQMTGVALSRSAPNAAGALTAAQILTGPAAALAFAQANKLPPVRRDVVVDTSADAAQAVFVQSALVARAWLDIDKQKTDTLYAGMIESVISGKSELSSAVAEVSLSLGALLREKQIR